MDMIFIRQDGNFLGHEIIEELEKRGGKNIYGLSGNTRGRFYTLSPDFYIIEVDVCPWNYREVRRIDDEIVEIQPRIIFSKNKLPIIDYGTEG